MTQLQKLAYDRNKQEVEELPEYAFVLLVVFFVTVLFHGKYKLQLFGSKFQMIGFYSIVMVIGIGWDQFAVGRGHWTYSDEFLLGPYVGYMPIEDYLFILVVVYFGLVLYRFSERFSRS